jgi:hypothetical protein
MASHRKNATDVGRRATDAVPGAHPEAPAAEARHEMTMERLRAAIGGAWPVRCCPSVGGATAALLAVAEEFPAVRAFMAEAVRPLARERAAAARAGRGAQHGLGGWEEVKMDSLYEAMESVWPRERSCEFCGERDVLIGVLAEESSPIRAFCATHVSGLPLFREELLRQERQAEEEAAARSS